MPRTVLRFAQLTGRDGDCRTVLGRGYVGEQASANVVTLLQGMLHLLRLHIPQDNRTTFPEIPSIPKHERYPLAVIAVGQGTHALRAGLDDFHGILVLCRPLARLFVLLLLRRL